MLLEVNNLQIGLKDSSKQLVSNASFQLKKGEVLALIGESGSGKTLTGLSLMGLLDNHTFSVQGDIIYKGKNMHALSPKKIAAFRLQEIAMVYQEPMASFNPLLRLDKQFYIALNKHLNCSKKEAIHLITPYLVKVGFETPIEIIRKYPHELSGGQLQRVMIALALTLQPKILLADEPTTALDVFSQNDIMLLLKKIAAEEELAILFISHDLNLVKDIANTIMIMKQGEVVEHSDVDTIFAHPTENYTKQLLKSRVSYLIEQEANDKGANTCPI